MKAPQQPTKVTLTPTQATNEILFAPELVPFILQEGKTVTYRYGNKYDHLHFGDEVVLKEYGTNKFIARAKVSGKSQISFGELPLRLKTHEEYDSKDHQRKVFSSYYSYLGKEIQDTDPFLILEFELIK